MAPSRRSFLAGSASFAFAAILAAMTPRMLRAAVGQPLIGASAPVELERGTAGGGAYHQFPTMRYQRAYCAPRPGRSSRKKTGRRM